MLGNRNSFVRNAIRSSKLLPAMTVSLLLSGCAGMFSGSYTEEVGMTSSGEVAVNTFTRQPVKLKKRQSKEAALAEAAHAAIRELAQVRIKELELEITEAQQLSTSSKCFTLSTDQYLSLKSGEAQVAYAEASDRCMERLQHQQNYQMLAGIIDNMSQGRSDIAQVADGFAQTIRSVSHEGTNRLQSLFSFGTKGLIAIELRKAKQSSDQALRDVGKSAAENSGDITVGNISLSSSQHSSADSNDGGAVWQDGDGSATTGSGSGTSSNARSGTDITVLNIGNNNPVGVATDAARTFVETQSTQQAEPSATQNQNSDGGRQNGVVVADEQNGTTNSSDDDANGDRSLF